LKNRSAREPCLLPWDFLLSCIAASENLDLIVTL
jgi:hypothetical protein